MRRVEFITGQYYHLTNRGVEGRRLFVDREDHVRFIENIRKHWIAEAKPHLDQPSRPRVTLLAYTLLGDHFHFLVRQESSGGITDFMHKLGTAFSMYFNNKYDRAGRLYEGPFKAKQIPLEMLVPLTFFIHLNLLLHLSEPPGLSEREPLLQMHPWSSYLEYMGYRQGTLCVREPLWALLPAGDSVLNYRRLVAPSLQSLDFGGLGKLVLEKIGESKKTFP